MYKNINADQFQKLITYSKPIVLDVRTYYEFHAGHIKSAILIPHNELPFRINEIKASKESDILIYCHAGHRSVAAAHYLLLQGYTSVYNLEAGIIEWEQKGKELEQ